MGLRGPFISIPSLYIAKSTQDKSEATGPMSPSKHCEHILMGGNKGHVKVSKTVPGHKELPGQQGRYKYEQEEVIGSGMGQWR